MDLVVGATGFLGSEICRRLRARGEDVRALVRKTSDRDKVERLRKLGCEIFVGDLQDKASLDRACRGIETVITTASTTISRQPHDSFDKTDLQGHLDLIDAAERNDVKRFVLISFSGGLHGESKLHAAKRAVEAKLRESGISYAILRPTAFMEVWFSPALGFDAQNRKAQVFGAGDRPFSFISLFDVAEFAVRAASGDTMGNQTVELGGPEAISVNNAIKIFEKELGGPFQVTRIPEEALKRQYAAATDDYQRAMAALAIASCGGDVIEMKDTLKRIPIKLGSIRDFARKLAGR